MGEINKYRAALLILSDPLVEDPPPHDIYPHGLMMASEPNPQFDEWAKGLFERLHALCVVKGIEPTASGGIDWIRLAIRLVFDYEPRVKGEPRIRIKRKRGAKPKHNKPAAEAARRELAKIVAKKRAGNARLSAKKIAEVLAGKDKSVLPSAFKHMAVETLRKQIERAEKEAEFERSMQRTLSEIFGQSPRAEPTSTGRGLLWRPNKKPG